MKNALKKLFRLDSQQRDRARQAVVNGIEQYTDKKPKGRAKVWGSIVGTIVAGVIFIHTGNPVLSGAAGDFVGDRVETLVQEREAHAAD